MVSQPDKREQPIAARKVRERALILPLIGLLILLPPIGSIFQLDMRIAGIPFTMLYLFIVWGLLIIGAAVLSSQLTDDESPGEESRPSFNIRREQV